MMEITGLEEKAKKVQTNAIARQFVDTEILYLLRFGDRSGYELRKDLMSAFSVNISYGTLYPHLHSLEESHMISGVWSQKDSGASLKKKVYSLTPNGALVLKNSAKSLAEIGITMQFMLSGISLFPDDVATGERLAALESAQMALNRLGFETSKQVKIRGSSGTEHTIELVGKRVRVKPEKVILRTVPKENLSIGCLLKVHVAARDVGASRAVILTVGTPSQEVMKLADFYGITISEGLRWTDAVLNMSSRMDMGQ
jgi:DNA-binding PadR family transcriptional regulator